MSCCFSINYIINSFILIFCNYLLQNYKTNVGKGKIEQGNIVMPYMAKKYSSIQFDLSIFLLKIKIYHFLCRMLLTIPFLLQGVCSKWSKIMDRRSNSFGSMALFKIFCKWYSNSCAIWYNFYNLRNVENTHGRALLLLKFQAES